MPRWDRSAACPLTPTPRSGGASARPCTLGTVRPSFSQPFLFERPCLLSVRRCRRLASLH